MLLPVLKQPLSMIEFTRQAGEIDNNKHVGSNSFRQDNVAKGRCPFCGHNSAFSQVGNGRKSELKGDMVALECDGCNCVFSASIHNSEIFPKPTPDKLDDIPESVARYYDEAVDCIGADAPNAAAAMFRKVIEAVCEEYGVTEVELDDDIYDMVNKMADEGHITEEHRKGLLALKDAGNDGVHLNDNDPDLDDARLLQNLVESVLTATVVARHRVQQTRKSFPNPHEDTDESQ